MNKLEFEQQLGEALNKAHVPQAEVERAVAFFGEGIEDRIEDGMSEEQAVESLGSIDSIALQVIQDLPAVPKAMVQAVNNTPTSTKVLAIILAVVLSPLWLPIAVGILAAVVSLYIFSWAIIFCIWIGMACMVLAPVAGVIFMVVTCSSAPPQIAMGLMFLGGTLLCSGLGLCLFLGILWITKWWGILTGRFFKWVKSLFVKDKTMTAEVPDEFVMEGDLA